VGNIDVLGFFASILDLLGSLLRGDQSDLEKN